MVVKCSGYYLSQGIGISFTIFKRYCYCEAGLLQLAKEAGHRAETLTSLALASHFKRTHLFILPSFEAIYRFFLRTYLSTLESSSTENLLTTAKSLACLLGNVSELENLLATWTWDKM